jgi:hypothetical protein
MSGSGWKEGTRYPPQPGQRALLDLAHPHAGDAQQRRDLR